MSYFEIKKNTETEKELRMLLNKSIECEKQAMRLCRDLGFGLHADNRGCFNSGIERLADPKSKEVLKDYVPFLDGYIPNENTKRGLEIRSRIDALDVVKESKLCDILGINHNSMFNITWGKDFIIIETAEKLNKDIKEISYSNYTDRLEGLKVNE